MDSEFIGVTVASMDAGAEPRACPVKRFGYMDVFTRVTAVNSEPMSRTVLNGPRYFQTKTLTPY